MSARSKQREGFGSAPDSGEVTCAHHGTLNKNKK